MDSADGMILKCYYLLERIKSNTNFSFSDNMEEIKSVHEKASLRFSCAGINAKIRQRRQNST